MGSHNNSRDIVKATIKQRLDQISKPDYDDFDAESPFMVADLGEIHRQHVKWKTLLPRIEPFFAIKCNPDPIAAEYLASLDVGFDCASKQEIEQVLKLGIDSTRIIYSQPYKRPSFLRFAALHNVALMVFDNEDELCKIKKLYPTAELVLRIAVDDAGSGTLLGGRKSGAPLNTVEQLLYLAKKLQLNVIGVSFHVGTKYSTEKVFRDAVTRCRFVFDQAEKIGFKFNFLNVGGGYTTITFDKVATVLRAALDEMFPPSENIRICAEPGRFYIDTAYTLCLNVVGRRVEQSSSNDQDPSSRRYMYYINDSFFGSFLMKSCEHIQLNLKVLSKGDTFLYNHDDRSKEVNYPSAIWGQTCCWYDCVVENIKLPELDIGDWLYLENAGAYTVASASNFNGFDKPRITHTNSYYD